MYAFKIISFNFHKSCHVHIDSEIDIVIYVYQDYLKPCSLRKKKKMLNLLKNLPSYIYNFNGNLFNFNVFKHCWKKSRYLECSIIYYL